MEEEPESDVPRLIYADWLEERGDSRAEIIRLFCDVNGIRQRWYMPQLLKAECALITKGSDGWSAVLDELREMAPRRLNDQMRLRCWRLLKGDVPIQLENLEATTQLQYDLQVFLLDSCGLLEAREDGESGIMGVDGKWYRLPQCETILGRLKTDPTLHQFIKQGFDTLLLEPFGVPLQRIVSAYRGELAKADGSKASSPAEGELVVESRLLGARSHTEYFIYDPTPSRGIYVGRTKEALLQEFGVGWRVKLVEGSVFDIPRQGHGDFLDGRRQRECHSGHVWERPPTLPVGEQPWTPETYLVRCMDAALRQVRRLDCYSRSALMGALINTSYQVAEARIPLGYASEMEMSADHGQRTHLITRQVGLRNDGQTGIRTAVHISI